MWGLSLPYLGNLASGYAGTAYAQYFGGDASDDAQTGLPPANTSPPTPATTSPPTTTSSPTSPGYAVNPSTGVLEQLPADSGWGWGPLIFAGTAALGGMALAFTLAMVRR